MSDFGGGLPAFGRNIAKAFARALDLSRESLLWSLLFALGAAAYCGDAEKVRVELSKEVPSELCARGARRRVGRVEDGARAV